ARSYVPLHPDRPIRLEYGSGRPLEQRMTPHRIVGRWFSFASDWDLPDGARGATAKAFLNPDPGLIAGFTPTDVFLKQFAATPPDEVHPEQAAVEIYQALNRDPAEDLMEAVGEHDAGLIVIGIRTRSATGKFLLGSNALEILHDAAVPVLCVKSDAAVKASGDSAAAQ
ncbi:MAG: DUF4380 domain-containing protein, partial [Actinomycetota bacterium]